MDGGAWWAAVHGVDKSQTWLGDFTFTFHFHALEKEMATHSSVLAWRIPGMGEPGGLLSMGSHRVRHDWSDLAAVAAQALNKYTSDIKATMILQLTGLLATFRSSATVCQISSNIHLGPQIARLLKEMLIEPAVGRGVVIHSGKMTQLPWVSWVSYRCQMSS